jgi:hypothetical protein
MSISFDDSTTINTSSSHHYHNHGGGTPQQRAAAVDKIAPEKRHFHVPVEGFKGASAALPQR